MFALWACLVAVVAAAVASPARYNQRQDGEMNVRADVQNVVFIVAIPQKLPFSLDSLEGLFKSGKTTNAEPEIQKRADHFEYFLEPSTPYRVDITRDAGFTPVPVVEIGNNEEVLKLLGAKEQCGPGRARDVEGVCRAVAEPPPEPAPMRDPAPTPDSAPTPDPAPPQATPVH